MADHLEQWKRDERAAFEGWDFSYIASRSSQDDPPWSYRDRAGELVRSARRLLDVDTGGGEFLLSLAPLPPGTKAIESYPPNVAVAREHLACVGVQVEAVAVGAPWPLGDADFDVILNRQGHLNVGETARCLAEGGTFLTQQVASGNLADLQAIFGDRTPQQENTLASTTAALEANGLSIRRAQTWTGRQTFLDVGALVYFLRAIPWVVKDFSVERNLSVLKDLQQRLDGGGNLTFSITRFLAEAVRPAG
jgi:hypothetical protein